MTLNMELRAVRPARAKNLSDSGFKCDILFDIGTALGNVRPALFSEAFRMPKRTDIKSIVIIGAGPIVIGQACEFDYSGTQACKALKEEGYRVILVNSNPATIMTDPALANATYIEPITPEIVAKILERERPDALLPTMGGQTGLNTALDLWHDGVLERLGVELIGAKADSRQGRRRQLFREAMESIGLGVPGRLIHDMDGAQTAIEEIGLPAILRPSFTLGGTGGGIAYNREGYFEIAESGLRASPTSESSLARCGLKSSRWKSFAITRTTASSFVRSKTSTRWVFTRVIRSRWRQRTLTDKEYQIMRNASINCLRRSGSIPADQCAIRRQSR